MALSKVYKGQHVFINRNLVNTHGFKGIVVDVSHPGYNRGDVCAVQLDDTMGNRVEPFSLSYLLEDPEWEIQHAEQQRQLAEQLAEQQRREEEEQARLRERKYGRRIQF